MAAYYADVVEDGAEAERWARADLDLRKNYATREALAWALYRGGRFREALDEVGQALASGIVDAHLSYHAAMINWPPVVTMKESDSWRKWPASTHATTISMCTVRSEPDRHLAPTTSGHRARTRARYAVMVPIVLTLIWIRAAGAHPVAQGEMEVVVFPDRVTVRATVSKEEVFVAAAARPNAAAGLNAVRTHGDYLLAHLHVTADGRPIPGRVVGRPEAGGRRPSYHLEYRFPADSPACLGFREDVLREIEFAPGFPCEASYLMRISHEGRPPAECLLLTGRQPLQFECSWPNSPTSEPLLSSQIPTGRGRPTVSSDSV